MSFYSILRVKTNFFCFYSHFLYKLFANSKILCNFATKLIRKVLIGKRKRVKTNKSFN